jgi:putative hydrolase of the HAD superfamily
VDIAWYQPPHGVADRRAVVVFDGDDTLWETEPLYDRARAAAASVVAAEGLDPVRFEGLQRSIDISNVSRLGFTAQRFPTSSVEAYEALVTSGGGSPSPAVAQLIFSVSYEVFRQPAPLIPGATETVRCLQREHRLVLLTKGDFEVQKKRISDSGLTDSFEAIGIVDVKSSDVFEAVLDALQVEPATCWSIGNSLSSDIEPALAIGMRAVWIDAPVWGFERSKHSPAGFTDPGLVVADAIAEVPGIVYASKST